jgi:hypothetical protein
MPVQHSHQGVVRVTSPDLYRTAKDIQQVVGGRKIVAEMKAEMRQAAGPIVRRVQAEAAVFSKRIPPAVKASTRFTKKTTAVLITVNARQAPHARPINNDGKQGFFTHPIPIRVSSTRRGRLRQAARGNTVRQKARPFFYGPIVAADHDVEAAVQRAADKALRKAGFR